MGTREKLQSKEEGRGCGQRGEDERTIDGEHSDGEKYLPAGAGAETVPPNSCCSHWSPARCRCLAFHLPVKWKDYSKLRQGAFESLYDFKRRFDLKYKAFVAHGNHPKDDEDAA